MMWIINGKITLRRLSRRNYRLETRNKKKEFNNFLFFVAEIEK